MTNVDQLQFSVGPLENKPLGIVKNRVAFNRNETKVTMYTMKTIDLALQAAKMVVLTLKDSTLFR